MRKIANTLAALVAATMTFAPLAAQETEPVFADRIKDKDDFRLDPAKSYLLVESPGPVISTFLRVPTEAEREDWERQRQEELAEALEDYPRDMKRYERRLERYDPSLRQGPPPVEPVKPTEQNFTWPDLEQRKLVSFGPHNRFAESGRASLWLYEVEPGEYIYYGMGMPGENNCACMGSVRFDVEPGKVTALRINSGLVDAGGNPVDEHPEGLASTDAMTRLALSIDAPSAAAYDPRIPRDMIVPADFTPVQRLPNWFGGMVNRVQPIPDVLAYDRGEVVDLRGGG